MFSVFAGIYFFVKCWLTYKSIMLTEKPFGKKRKTVYEFFFRKPFSLNAPHTHASLSLPNSLCSSPWATSSHLSLAQPLFPDQPSLA